MEHGGAVAQDSGTGARKLAAGEGHASVLIDVVGGDQVVCRRTIACRSRVSAWLCSGAQPCYRAGVAVRRSRTHRGRSRPLSSLGHVVELDDPQRPDSRRALRGLWMTSLTV